MTPWTRRSPLFLALLCSVAMAACGGPGRTASPPSGQVSSTPPSSASPAAPAPSASPPAPTQPPAAFDPTAVSLSLEAVADGFDSPLAVVTAGDGSGRIFVVEQGGTIRLVRDGAVTDGAFLDIADRITSGGERGLLGVAFHPDFPSDPRVFVDYTDSNGDTVVSSFTLDPANPDRADPGSEVPLLSIEQPYANHNGGAIAFGQDGFLYIATGDGGSGGDPHGNGQSTDTLLGKILRIDIDRAEGARRYATPPDNPLVGQSGQPEIFAWGLRNPWRMSVDRATGDLWIGDVGQGAWEEIDVIRSGTSGQNFGWNRMEGSHCFRPSDSCDDDSLIPPVTEYARDAGSTVIGGVVYRGTAQPGFPGGYVFADYGSGNVWVIDAALDGPTEPTLVLASSATISSFGEDEAGEIYATDLRSGELLHVVAAPR